MTRDGKDSKQVGSARLRVLYVGLVSASLIGGCSRQDTVVYPEGVTGCYDLTWMGDSTYAPGVLPDRVLLSLQRHPLPADHPDSLAFYAVEIADSIGYYMIRPYRGLPSDSLDWGDLAWWRFVPPDSATVIFGSGADGAGIRAQFRAEVFRGQGYRWTDYSGDDIFQVQGTRVDCEGFSMPDRSDVSASWEPSPIEASISTPEDLVGRVLHDDSFPAQIIDLGYGWVVEDGWTVSQVMHGDGLWVVLEGLAGPPNEYGYQTERVLDVLQLPQGETPADLAVGCRLNGGPADWSVFGVVDYTNENWLAARGAWRANTALGRFEPVPVNGLECHNEGSGI